MLETVHVAVWLVVLVTLALGGLIGYLAAKNKVSPVVEAETLLGEARTEVAKFDAGVFATIKQLEAEGKADAGAAVKYVESTVGIALKKL